MKPEERIDAIIVREGGYVDHPNDRGGPTNHGITEAVARSYGYTGSMRDLPIFLAHRILMERYYIKPHFDQVALRSEPLADEMTDTGVNMGVMWPGLFLQQSLNAFNLRATLYPDLKEDGDVAGKTLAALDLFIKHRGTVGVAVLIKAMNCLQGARYVSLSQSRPANEDFVYGWIRERA